MIAAGIEYRAHGEGDPVVCLHGIGGSFASFEPQMQGLGDRRQVLAWSMPGYSQSTEQELTFENLSNVLAHFIEELGLGAVHLVGQSIGGMVALEHAVRRMDQVQSLTLIGTTPSFGGRDDSFKDAFLKARLAPLEAGQSMADMAAQSAPNIVGPEAGEECIRSVEQPMAAVSTKTWRAILECLVTFNRRDDLADLTIPVCLIAGSQDKNAPARTMAKMGTVLPNSEYHELQGIGHMINQEAPEQTNTIIRTFLDRLN